MPDRGVTPHPLAVGQSVVDDLVGRAEVEVAAGRFRGVPLHLVLRGDHVELPVENRGVRRVAQPAGSHGGTEVPAGRGRLRTQRAGRVGRPRDEKRGRGGGQHGDRRRQADRDAAAADGCLTVQGFLLGVVGCSCAYWSCVWLRAHWAEGGSAAPRPVRPLQAGRGLWRAGSGGEAGHAGPALPGEPYVQQSRLPSRPGRGTRARVTPATSEGGP